MAKDPAFLFYSSDFLVGTMTMTDEQTGKYIKLLCLQHQKGILSEKDMINICKSYDEDIYCKFIKDESGFFNKRLKDESEKRANYSKSRSDNRKQEKVLTYLDASINNICLTCVNHMENENINENINIICKSCYKKSNYKKVEKIAKSLIERLEEFYQKVENCVNTDRPQYLFKDDELKSFCSYWTEHSENDKKMRFEKETSYELSRRLDTWFRNSKNFGYKNKDQPDKVQQLKQTMDIALERALINIEKEENEQRNS